MTAFARHRLSLTPAKPAGALGRPKSGASRFPRRPMQRISPTCPTRPTGVVLTSAPDNGLSLAVGSQASGETYCDLHRQAPADLLTALQLDPPE